MPLPLRSFTRQHVTAICQICQHAALLDVPALIDAGHGDTALDRLALRCAACGGRDVVCVVGGRMAWE